MTDIRRLVAMTTLALVAFAPSAFAAPHGEEQDGCDHGATGKPCKVDPQPDHGADCEEHGNHGGVNEDHCVTTVTTSTTPTTTPTSTPSTPDPTPTTTTTTSPAPTTTTTATPPITDTTPAPDSPTSTTTSPQVPTASPTDPAPTAPTPTAVTELPHTGLGSTLLLVLGGWLLLSGLVSLALAQLIRGAR